MQLLALVFRKELRLHQLHAFPLPPIFLKLLRERIQLLLQEMLPLVPKKLMILQAQILFLLIL
ncbi:MAG: hypothetical protein EBU88_12905 [Acidobacteria bacterium]|nr:hypothetical protein [Acidobacteriota bacterium]